MAVKSKVALTDEGLTYFTRKSFQVSMERAGVFADGEWETVAEMCHALDGTDLMPVVSVVHMDVLMSVCDGHTRMVSAASHKCDPPFLEVEKLAAEHPEQGEEPADDGAQKRADDDGSPS